MHSVDIRNRKQNRNRFGYLTHVVEVKEVGPHTSKVESRIGSRIVVAAVPNKDLRWLG